MNKIPVINAKTMEKVLFNLGFKKIRQKGSHAFYKHPDGRTTTVLHHQGRDLAVPLIKEILKDIKLSVDEFIEYNK